MSQGPNPQQRMTPEQRRRLEELEEAREAERLNDMARQRELLQQWDEDRYVSHRMERERENIADDVRAAHEEDLRQLGGVPASSPGRLLFLGACLSGALIALLYFVGKR